MLTKPSFVHDDIELEPLAEDRVRASAGIGLSADIVNQVQVGGLTNP